MDRVDNFPIMARHSDGSPIPVEVSLVRVQDASHHLMGSVAVIHDRRRPEDLVSQMQKQEMALIRLNRNLELANLELERANRLKDEFLANTSHELRTPLSAILGFLRIVLDKLCDDPAEEHEFIQNAYDSARNLLNLINELLDTAKIEAGKVDLNLVKVEVSQVFEEVKKLSQVQAAQKGLRLTFQAHQVKVRADPDKLHQVLLNLVANALKFTQAGEVQVTARPFRAKGHVRFEISDTGIGIPQEIQRDLFQKFVQGDGSTSRKYGGSGSGAGHLQEPGGVHGWPDLALQPRSRARHHGLFHPALNLRDAPLLAPPGGPGTGPGGPRPGGRPPGPGGGRRTQGG